jgi:exopolysaccharide production protein ExoQ
MDQQVQMPSSMSKSRARYRNVGRAIDQPRGLGSLLTTSAMFWLIFYMNMPDNLEGYAGAALTEPVLTENPIARNIKVGMLLMSSYLIVARWAMTRSLLKNINVGAAAFLMLAPLSAVWSIDPAATLLRSISLLAFILVCFAAGVAGWNRHRFQEMTIPPVMFILLGSLVVGMIYPDQIAEIGTDISQRNAWHGITHGKNEFGMVASFGVIICTNAWLAREGRNYWAITGAVIAFACLFLSRSNTSELATIVGVFSMLLLMRVRVIRQRYSTHVAIAIAATIILYELIIQDVIPGVHFLLSPITGLFGKDTTFSARTIIWDVIKQHIQGAPYLGTGYGAYWVGPFPTSPSYVFVPLMYFYPTESHNGYLEVVNDLGLLGLMCVLLFLFWYIRQALQLIRFDRSQGALYLALLFQEMIINMSESDWFSRTNTFAMLLLATICLSRALVDVRLRPQVPRTA